jgi:iron complex outermembrane receptor protein
VASGEEEFSGGRMELRWAPVKTLQLGLKGAYTSALTTASPDLPQEVGRPITRLPPVNLSANLRHRPAGVPAGFNWGAGWQYLAGYVANYPDARRDQLEYPGYGLVSLSSGWQWQHGPRQLGLDAAVRNAFNRNLTVSHARVDAGREFIFSARMMF